MELKYVWVKDYKMFNNFGVNLSHSGTDFFIYDGDSFKIQTKEKPILSFGNNISSITAIAGQNGSGKSTLFEMLIYSIATYSDGAMGYSKPMHGIMCIENFIFYQKDLKGINEALLAKSGYKIFSYQESPFENMPQEWRMNKDKVGFVYYSNVLDWRGDFHELNLNNISTEGNLFYDVGYGPSNTNQEKNYDITIHNFDIKSDIEALHIEESYHFTKLAINLYDFFPFNEPKVLIINLTYSGNNRFLKNTKGNSYWFEKSIFDDFLKIKDTYEEKCPPNVELFQQAQYRLYKLNISKTIIEDYFDQPWIGDFIFNNDTSSEYFKDKKDLIDLLERFQFVLSKAKYPDLIYPSSASYRYRGCVDWRYYVLKPIELQNTPDIRTALKEIISLEEKLLKYSYNQRKRLNNYFLFEDLSSGENSFYTLFSRLYRLIQENKLMENEKKDSFIIFIDEAEIGFHPEWKKNFLAWMVDFFNKEFVDVNVQLILSTHSPYFLSDLHTDNLILLKKDKEGITHIQDVSNKRTFGANIHELLAESFFLEDGLIGRYAKNKIDELIAYLKNPETLSTFNVASAQKLIKIVGEPLIRDILQTKYNENFQSDEEIQTQIEDLQSKLKNRKQ